MEGRDRRCGACLRGRAIIQAMPTQDAARSLADALESLAGEVEALTFPTQSQGHDARVRDRDRVGWVIREFLLRRLADLDGALRVVIVGPTGSGTSTLMNSLAETNITESGPLRPTTMVPVVWCDPRLEPEFAFDFLSGFGTGPDASRPLRVVAQRHPIVEALALVDAPDIDSIETDHRKVAEMLADAADLCLLVVSRHRYADAAVWDFVRHLSDRPVPMAAVMNRLERGDEEAAEDFQRRLDEAGFPRALVGMVAEQPLEDGRLPTEALESVHTWLTTISDSQRRGKRVMDGVTAALGGLFRHLDALDKARQDDRDEGERLRDAAATMVRARGVDLLGRIALIPTRADLAALVEREIGEARRQVGAAWADLAGGPPLLDALGEVGIHDIDTTVETRVSDEGSDDELQTAIREVFERYAAAIGDLVPEPRPIESVERAAALVMEAGRRLLDA